MSFAKKLFDARAYIEKIEEEFWNEAMRIVGCDLDSVPFSDHSFDYYDESFELWDVRPGTLFSPEQLQHFWDLGFGRCWLNYSDGSEMHYWEQSSQGTFKANVRSPSCDDDRIIRDLRRQLFKLRARK